MPNYIKGWLTSKKTFNKCFVVDFMWLDHFVGHFYCFLLACRYQFDIVFYVALAKLIVTFCILSQRFLSLKVEGHLRSNHRSQSKSKRKVVCMLETG